MKVKICFEYNGKDFAGYQVQPDKRTVQGVLESALSGFFDEKVCLTASGRTDAGVHAMAQVGDFVLSHKKNNFNIKNLPNALNPVLPQDVKIINAKNVSDDFNSRFNAKKKTYLYKLYKSEYDSPLFIGYAVKVSKNIDIKAMKNACKALVGKHDFSAFASSGNDTKDFVRTIYSTKVVCSDGIIKFEICGNGFLYNMVRIIVGTLIEVGQHKKSEDVFIDAYQKKDRNILGKTAPAYGLYLKSVKY